MTFVLQCESYPVDGGLAIMLIISTYWSHVCEGRGHVCIFVCVCVCVGGGGGEVAENKLSEGLSIMSERENMFSPRNHVSP